MSSWNCPVGGGEWGVFVCVCVWGGVGIRAGGSSPFLLSALAASDSVFSPLLLHLLDVFLWYELIFPFFLSSYLLSLHLISNHFPGFSLRVKGAHPPAALSPSPCVCARLCVVSVFLVCLYTNNPAFTDFCSAVGPTAGTPGFVCWLHRALCTPAPPWRSSTAVPWTTLLCSSAPRLLGSSAPLLLSSQCCRIVLL